MADRGGKLEASTGTCADDVHGADDVLLLLSASCTTDRRAVREGSRCPRIAGLEGGKRPSESGTSLCAM